MNKSLKTYNLLDRIENNFVIVLFKNSFMTVSPFLIIGAFALTLYAFPIQLWQDFLGGTSGALLKTILLIGHQYTLELLSLILIISISFNYSRIKAPQYTLIYMITSLSSYCAFVFTSETTLSFDIFASEWTFTAIIISLFVCFSLDFVLTYLKKKLSFKHYINPGQYAVGLFTILPSALIIALFALAGQLLYIKIGSQGVQNNLSLVISSFFQNMGNNFISALLFQFNIHLMWILGIHGNGILQSVASELFVPVIGINQLQVARGLQATGIFSMSFMNVFVAMGGSGTALSLVIALLIGSRKKRHRRIALSSLIPVLCNISETVVFGLPVIFNPYLLIPFILVPLISLTIATIATASGFMPVVSTSVIWTTPVILSGYLATGSVTGSIIQVMNLIIGVLIYLPFVKKMEKANDFYKNEITKIASYISACDDATQVPHLLNNTDFKPQIIQSLATELIEAMTDEELTLHYQPQVNSDGKIVGAEGLLRWQHPDFGYLSPLLIIQLAKEMELIKELSLRNVRIAAKDLAHLTRHGIEKHVFSVNITASLLADRNYCECVQEIVSKHEFADNAICLEITEREIFNVTPQMKDNIKNLTHHGITIAMDDFGMGHSSISILQELNFSYVKLDGSLVKTLDSNKRSNSIVKAVCELSEKLGYEVIGEYVETQATKERLYEAGCKVYQGYLYAKPMPFDQLKKYMEIVDSQ